MDIKQVTSTYKFSMVFIRWVAFTIDSFLLVVLFFGLVAANILISSEKYIALTWIVWVILALSYYIYFEGVKGQTLGKYILKLRVVDIEGNPPGLKKSVIRTLLKFIELNPFIIAGMIGGIVAVFTKNKQRIGDLLAKTYVIKINDILPNIGSNDISNLYSEIGSYK